MLFKNTVLMVCIFFPILSYAKSTKVGEDVLIPRSTTEKCQYYLVKSEKVKGNIRATHKQVCPKNEYYSGVGFSITDINCNNRKYKSLGYGDDLVSNVTLYKNTKWTKLITGSSKSDLVSFVCK
jgi:hypothetical protein